MDATLARRSQTYARLLFGTACAVNLQASLGLLFARAVLAPLLQLAPVAGTNIWFANFSGAMIGLFGVVYGLIARDPTRWRITIPISVAGKVLAVVAAAFSWLSGDIGFRLPLLLLPDLVFAALFVDFFRATRPAQTLHAHG